MIKNSKGFTLIELIAVIAILGIMSAIAVPRLVGYRKMTIERVCNTNRVAVERLYNVFLLENPHNNNTFNKILIENFDVVCPGGGAISYFEGKVKCSLHGDVDNNDEEEPPGGEVPWL